MDSSSHTAIAFSLGASNRKTTQSSIDYLIAVCTSSHVSLNFQPQTYARNLLFKLILPTLQSTEVLSLSSLTLPCYKQLVY